MTFTEMQEQLSEYIAESGVKTFPLAQRKFWLNRGVIEVCRLTSCLEKKVAKNVTAGTAEYDIVTDWALTDFLKFTENGITHYNGSATAPVYTTLVRRTPDWMDKNRFGWRNNLAADQSDTPELYVPYGNTKVIINPTPKTAVTSGWLLYYHYYPIQGTTKGGLVGGTDVPFDSAPQLEPYHMIPVFYAAFRALTKAGVPKSQQALQEFSAGIKMMSMDLARQPDYEGRPSVFNYRAR